ncbi:MAG: hypothetical protein ACERLM_13365, partial [Acidimicrobiales bacterium]
MAEKIGLPGPPEVGASALVPGTYEGVGVFVTGGGTVLVDAYAGSAEFADSALRELQATFGELQPLDHDNI